MRADQFFRVENFPLLGTGKLDFAESEGNGGAGGGMKLFTGKICNLSGY